MVELESSGERWVGIWFEGVVIDRKYIFEFFCSLFVLFYSVYKRLVKIGFDINLVYKWLLNNSY